MDIYLIAEFVQGIIILEDIHMVSIVQGQEVDFTPQLESIHLGFQNIRNTTPFILSQLGFDEDGRDDHVASFYLPCQFDNDQKGYLVTSIFQLNKYRWRNCL